MSIKINNGRRRRQLIDMSTAITNGTGPNSPKAYAVPSIFISAHNAATEYFLGHLSFSGSCFSQVSKLIPKFPMQPLIAAHATYTSNSTAVTRKEHDS